MEIQQKRSLFNELMNESRVCFINGRVVGSSCYDYEVEDGNGIYGQIYDGDWFDIDGSRINVYIEQDHIDNMEVTETGVRIQIAEETIDMEFHKTEPVKPKSIYPLSVKQS